NRIYTRDKISTEAGVIAQIGLGWCTVGMPRYDTRKDITDMLGTPELVLPISIMYIADHYGLEDIVQGNIATLTPRLLSYLILASVGESRHVMGATGHSDATLLSEDAQFILDLG